MKKFLLASVALLVAAPAFAADLPPRPAPVAYRAPPPAVVYFSWTGFYLGGNIGGAWANRNVTENFFGTNFNSGSNGVFMAGGQIGGNYQFGNFVVGAEADFDWLANNTNNGNGVLVAGNTISVTSNNRWITTAAARFGVAFDRVLVYGKAGGGWVGTNGFTVTNVTTGASVSAGSNTASGWLVGAGVEWAFASNWSMKLEYDYLGLSNWSYTAPATFGAFAGDTFTSSNRNVQMVKLGFNYLFNSPVAARY
jgi:outer membrane immunogenic protein